MKNNLLKLSAILLLLVTLVILAASCGETVTTTPEPVDTTPAVTTTAAITTEKYVEVFDETVTGTNYTSSIRAARSDLFFYNKLYKAGPFAGDPYLFYDEGTFYLYGTTRKYVRPGSIVEEFEVYTSKDLVTWEDGCARSYRGG